MRVVRDQLYRASLGVQALPHTANWPREEMHFKNEELTNSFSSSIEISQDLPVWATASHSVDDARAAANAAIVHSESEEVIKNQTGPNRGSQGSTVISDLPKMSQEVASLLEAIEINLYRQRNRRLEKLRPPSRWRRNWYMFAIGIPTAMFIGHKLIKEHGGESFRRFIFTIRMLHLTTLVSCF